MNPAPVSFSMPYFFIFYFFIYLFYLYVPTCRKVGRWAMGLIN